ncbi:MAG: preprotein translocase subunit YajC [Bacteroidaceae bacterium]|nr:preprotein translocase subunit YajC [Bacteroidaceae bacterium]MBR5848983.1 preprotein translocase subunit YajC [Bacteroidaceae bacterium]
MSTLLNAAGGMQAILGSPLFMFVIIIAIMYFMMIRPQRKRQKEIDNFRRGLQSGQSVITSGGIYGKIKSVEDTAVNIEISHNVVIRVDKNCVYADPAAMQSQQTAN